jgi:hypothetical protein
MTTYKIISDKTSLGKSGATVSIDDLAGLDVGALVAGGHLEPVSVYAVKKSDKKEQE